jgi:hypothetical protein
MNDLLCCINEQRREIYETHDNIGNLSEEEELSLLTQRMLALENHYHDFQNLNIIKELRSFLAHKMFDNNNDKKKEKEKEKEEKGHQQLNSGPLHHHHHHQQLSSHSSHAHSCLDKARREVIQDLKDRILGTSDSLLLVSGNDEEFNSSSSYVDMFLLPNSFTKYN